MAINPANLKPIPPPESNKIENKINTSAVYFIFKKFLTKIKSPWIELFSRASSFLYGLIYLYRLGKLFICNN